MLGLPFSGKLEKLTILAYDDISDDGIPLSVPIPFPVMFNPASFTEDLTRTWSNLDVTGQGGSAVEFTKTNSADISMDFIFDATGASVNSPLATVAKEAGSVDVLIELFKRTCYEQRPTTHKPPFLTIVWGTFLYSCVLSGYKVAYDLFTPSGRPIRATVSCTFQAYRGRLLDALILNRSSPDLTHTHVVKAGDTLYNIADKIYGDSQLYLEIARINNINNPRNLNVGDVLVLPPINQNVA